MNARSGLPLDVRITRPDVVYVDGAGTVFNNPAVGRTAVINTPILSQISAEHIGYMTARIPLGRVGEPSEVASLICWLASEEMSFSTAACFDISGGRATY